MRPIANGFRQRLWRWHFFAGLMVCPFLILISVTGSIYLFKAELEGWEERGINSNSSESPALQQTRGAPVGEAVLLQNVLAQYPGATFVRLTLAKPGDRTVEFDILPQESIGDTKSGAEHQHHDKPNTQKLTIWVDRYSGALLEVKVSDDRFLNIVKKLHSELLLGNWASYIVELVACWAIVLLISGVMLWFCRPYSSGERTQVKPSQQIFLPRLKSNGRVNLRTVHGVVGLYIAIPLLLMLLTGLPWTQLWGNGFKEIKESAGWGGAKQEWFVTLKSDNSRSKRALPETELWEISDNAEQSIDLNDSRTATDESLDTLTDIVNRPELKSLRQPIHISPPKPDNGVWTVRSMPQDRSKRVTLHFDQFSAEPIMRIGFEDHHIVQQVVSHGISLHEGALFGTVNKVLVLITALLTAVLSILGLVTWWNRRLPNSLGIPRKANYNLPVPWLVTMLGLCLFLPAVGLSLLILVSLELFWSRVIKNK